MYLDLSLHTWSHLAANEVPDKHAAAATLANNGSPSRQGRLQSIGCCQCPAHVVKACKESIVDFALVFNLVLGDLMFPVRPCSNSADTLACHVISHLYGCVVDNRGLEESLVMNIDA